MKQISYRGEVSRSTRAIAASVAILFFLASCSWAPNQDISSSKFNIGISSSDINPQQRSGDSTTMFGGIASTLSLNSQTTNIGSASLGAMQVEEGLDIDIEFDSESALILYYVERDVLAAGGLEPIDSGALLDGYFERRYGTRLSEDLEFEFDAEAFEQFIYDLYASYGIDLSTFEDDPEAELDLSEEEQEELFTAFFLAIIEFLFTPFIAFFEFIQTVLANGVVLENRLASGAGAYQLFLRGGSIADSNSTVNFALRDLRLGVEYVVIVGYYESFYEQGEVTPIPLEAFGFGSFTLEEGIDSQLTISASQNVEAAETDLEGFLGIDANTLDMAANLDIQPPDFLVDFDESLETEFTEIDFGGPLEDEPE